MNKFFSYIRYLISIILKLNRTLIGTNALLIQRNNYKNVTKITDCELKIFSQFGEDGIIDFILNTIKLNKVIRFVEIGVGNYEEANTRYLIESRPCSGLIIDKDRQINFVKKRNFYWQNSIQICNRTVSPENINKILEDHNFLKNFDLLSLDVDGLDYWILSELDLQSTSVLIIEYNPIFGSDYKITIPNLKNFCREDYHKYYFGMSLKALKEICEKKGFYFIGSNSSNFNAFFVNNKYRDLFQNIKIENIEYYTQFYFDEARDEKIKKSHIEFLNKILNFDVYDIDKSKLVKIKNIIKN